MWRLALIFITALFAEDKITTHSIETDGGLLEYTATVGSIPCEKGEIGYIAYVREGHSRPVTFAFNGGPGSSSVWLHMGAFGPRRALTSEEGQAIAPPYQIIDNRETILDLTDLVFIDPMGTGLSKATSKDDAKEFYGVTEDIRAVGNFIRDYLTSRKLWNCPKYVAGESYGALRAAGLADFLQNEYGIYLNGIMLISPAIDYQTFIFDNDNPLPNFLFFPSYVTTAWYHGKYRPEASLEEVAEEARGFTYESYAPALICRKCFDADPIYRRIAEMTSLPESLVRRNKGRIRDELFATELLASENKIVGRFDSRAAAYCTDPLQDPSDSLISGIFSGAMHDYLQRELECSSNYCLVSFDVNRQWNYSNYNEWGYPNTMNGLRRALIANPTLKIFVGCGYYDLATPFAASEYCFDHLDVPNIFVQMEYYEGGHMYYLNPQERKKFKRDLIQFYQR